MFEIGHFSVYLNLSKNDFFGYFKSQIKPFSYCLNMNLFNNSVSGYFSHVTTTEEVKEKVLKYISVMARPIVLFKDSSIKKHLVKWTGMYADSEVGNRHQS